MISSAENPALAELARSRRRVALVLTLAMVLIYFGFIGLIAWNKPLVGQVITPGISVGIVLGAAVIVSCWVLTWIYVRWANAVHDPAMARLRRDP